jgi:RNA polymerase sigma-70 factor (ECF subfamily)
MPDGSAAAMTTQALGWHDSLVDRARLGDVRAFERLYRDHCGRVHAVCLRLTREHALAEDCTQEAFIRAWRSLANFESRSNVGTWLHRIAVNVVLERRRRPDRRLEFVDELPEPADHECALDTPVEEAELEAAIASLPEGARDVLVLCGIHGYSHAEASTMLGIAEGTCKAQLHRARALLRARLAGEST